MKQRSVALEGELAFFRARRQDEILILELEDQILVRATDLGARDAVLHYLDAVAEAESIRAVVILGAPHKTGGDEYVEFYRAVLESASSLDAIHRMYNVVNQVVIKLVTLNKFVVHADHGRIMPLLLNLSLACDYRLVGEDTVYQHPYLELGLLPKGGGAFFLAKMLGVRTAFKIMTSERDLPATEALALGIVDGVVATDTLLVSALEAARRYAALPACTVSGLKRLVNFELRDLKEYLDLENQELLRIVGYSEETSDFRRRLRACR